MSTLCRYIPKKSLGQPWPWEKLIRRPEWRDLYVGIEVLQPKTMKMMLEECHLLGTQGVGCFSLFDCSNLLVICLDYLTCDLQVAQMMVGPFERVRDPSATNHVSNLPKGFFGVHPMSARISSGRLRAGRVRSWISFIFVVWFKEVRAKVYTFWNQSSHAHVVSSSCNHAPFEQAGQSI
ncbi:unnamed protein product [Cuscuta europaea]|uniref:Uncharacterized protein n=1 Tax=Cuscuta europaea TaxID=41803 RepID=A0A9P0YSM8_CUSEU|nr:unnamed protein product [Cuscuta europaea]